MPTPWQTAKLTKVIKPKIIIKNPFTDPSNYKINKKPKYILKAKTKTNTEPKLIMGIETPLDTMSIALQDRKERNQKSLSKQIASVTPPFIKGKKLQTPNVWAQRIQKFENQMRMPPEGKSQKDIFPIITGAESIKATQPKKTRSAAATPFKRTKRVHSVPLYNTESH